MILIVIIVLILLIYFIIKNIEWRIKFEQRVKEEIEKREYEIRRDAIKRSARILSGKALEKLIPFLKEFPYDAHDLRWIGDPIDFIIFDGFSSGKINKVVFCEIKSGKSKLSSLQKKIKDIIKNKKVEWNEFRIH